MTNHYRNNNRRQLFLVGIIVLFLVIVFFLLQQNRHQQQIDERNNEISSRANTAPPRSTTYHQPPALNCLSSPFPNDPDQAVIISGKNIRYFTSTTMNKNTSSFSSSRSLFIVDDYYNNKHCSDDEQLKQQQQRAKTRTAFLQSCGWNHDHAQHDETTTNTNTNINPLYTSVFKTNSQLLRFVSSDDKDGTCFDRKSSKLKTDETLDETSPPKTRVHFLYRTLHDPFHLYHSIFGPFGLFQLFSLKERFLEKYSYPNARNDTSSKRTSFEFKYKIIHVDDPVFGASSSSSSSDTNRSNQKTRKQGSFLAKEMFQLALDGEVPEMLTTSRSSSTEAGEEDKNEADIIVYGGFGHEVTRGKLFDDSELEVDEVTRRMMQKLSEKLRTRASMKFFGSSIPPSSSSILKKRKQYQEDAGFISHADDHQTILQRKKTVFFSLRPFCYEEGVGPVPRFRGLRPALGHEIDKLLEEELRGGQLEKVHRISTISSSLSSDKNDDSNHHEIVAAKFQIKTALTSNIFIFSEGADLVLQLFAPPNSTIFMVYDHWSMIPSMLRHPAYHTKIASALSSGGYNHHELIVITLWRIWKVEEVKKFFDGKVKEVLLDSVLVTNSETKRRNNLQFIGSADVFFDEKSQRWMNPNGRQNFSIEFSHHQSRQEEASSMTRMALTKVAKHVSC